VTFAAPGRLWLLLAVLALAASYVVLQFRRRGYAVRFTELELLASVAPRVPGWRRQVPAAAFLLLLTAMTLAWARPQAERRVPREQATVMVALDVSNSMSAVDVSPTRIAAAKAAAVDFVSGLPQRLRVGLVAFDGNAREVAVPTDDHAAVAAAIRGLRLGPATAIGEAVYASLAAIRDDAAVSATPGSAPLPPPPARVVLLSDGTNTVGRDPLEAAQAARDSGVPVSTIAYGTPDGVVEIEGREIPVPADVGTLRALAQDSGGTAYTAASDEELRGVYRDIGSQVGTRVEKRDVTEWYVGAGLLAAAVAGVTSLLWFSRLP